MPVPGFVGFLVVSVQWFFRGLQRRCWDFVVIHFSCFRVFVSLFCSPHGTNSSKGDVGNCTCQGTADDVAKVGAAVTIASTRQIEMLRFVTQLQGENCHK